jgi:hypothetical protein
MKLWFNFSVPNKLMDKEKLHSFEFLYLLTLDSWNVRGKFHVVHVICLLCLLTYTCNTYIIASALFEYCYEVVLTKGGNFM